MVISRYGSGGTVAATAMDRAPGGRPLVRHQVRGPNLQVHSLVSAAQAASEAGHTEFDTLDARNRTAQPTPEQEEAMRLALWALSPQAESDGMKDVPSSVAGVEWAADGKGGGVRDPRLMGQSSVVVRPDGYSQASIHMTISVA